MGIRRVGGARPKVWLSAIYLTVSLMLCGTQLQAASSGTVSLDFQDTEIKEVVSTILGDMLGYNFTVDPQIRGQISLQTAGPVPVESLLPILESALEGSGHVVVKENDLYQVVLEGKLRSGNLPKPTRSMGINQGYQTLIVPLQYVSAKEMQSLVNTLASAQQIVRADEHRNLLILAGREQDLRNLYDTIALFDENQFAGKSFKIFPLQAVPPSTVVTEIEAILGTDDSPLAGMVQLISLARMNAVLAVSQQQEYLDELEAWIERLDRADTVGGRRLYVYQAQNVRASDLEDTLSRLLEDNQSVGNPDDPQSALPWGSVNVVADTNHNSLLILATAADYAALIETIKSLDTSLMQVMVEATIAEVSLTGRLSYGVQWFFDNTIENRAGTGGMNFGLGLSSGFNYVVENGATATLEMLATETKVDVVSSPSLLVRDNHTASIRVGDQVPVRTSETLNTGTGGTNPLVTSTIEFRDTGVLLEVTPRINTGGVVMLDIVQEVNDVNTTSTSDIDSPTIRQRRLTTNVASMSGETIILGGLIRKNRGNSSSGVPILRKVPLLGNAFKNRDKSEDRTELLIFIRPVVIENMAGLSPITDELSEKFQAFKQSVST